MDSNFGRKVKCKTLLGNSITGTYVKKALAGWHHIDTGNGYIGGFKHVSQATFDSEYKPKSASHEPRMFIFE